MAETAPLIASTYSVHIGSVGSKRSYLVGLRQGLEVRGGAQTQQRVRTASGGDCSRPVTCWVEAYVALLAGKIQSPYGDCGSGKEEFAWG